MATQNTHVSAHTFVFTSMDSISLQCCLRTRLTVLNANRQPTEIWTVWHPKNFPQMHFISDIALTGLTGARKPVHQSLGRAHVLAPVSLVDWSQGKERDLPSFWICPLTMLGPCACLVCSKAFGIQMPSGLSSNQE